MARPKSDDPKVPVPLRLPASVLARYEALGAGWRAVAEAVLTEHVVPRAVAAKPFVSRLKGEWKAP
jgi:uncharacterized protein (DUF4415 family)